MANIFNSTLKVPKGVNDIRKKVSNTISQNTIDDFKANVGSHGGLAKADRFLIFLSPPKFTIDKLINTDIQGLASTALSGNLSLSSFINDPRDVAVFCENCSMPGRVLQVVEAPGGSYHTTNKRVSGYLNDDVTMTWHITNDWWIKKMFDSWHEFIISQSTYQIRTFPNMYTSDIVVQHINEQNIPTYAIKLKNAFPQNIQSIALDNNSTDTTLKLSVTFSYDDFVNEGSIASTISGVKASIGKLLKY